MELSDIQKIGFGLLICGISFLGLGVMLFFDRGLLALGNILFITGLVLLIGLQRTIKLCFQKNKLSSTAFASFGVALIILGWTIIGMILEVYGLLRLFGGLIPTVIGFLRQLPIIGHLLMLPGIAHVTDQVFGSRSMV